MTRNQKTGEIRGLRHQNQHKPFIRKALGRIGAGVLGRSSLPFQHGVTHNLFGINDLCVLAKISLAVAFASAASLASDGTIIGPIYL